MADDSDQKKIENYAKKEEEEEEEICEKMVKENDDDDAKLVEEDEEDDWEIIDAMSEKDKENDDAKVVDEGDWEKIDVQSEKIDKEIDDDEEEVKEEEQDCNKIDDRSEKIDEENDDDDDDDDEVIEEEEEDCEKIDDWSEKIDKENDDDEAQVVKAEYKEIDFGNRNQDYWIMNWNHWIYRRERMEKLADYPSCCSYGPISIDDPFKWQAAILGPLDSPYEDGVFFLAIDLPPDYPNGPPTITFKTKVFHPNIDEHGKIYVDILEEEEWKPIHTIESLLMSICSLLADPDPVDPTFESCYLFRNDRESYFNKAREWTRIYAM